MEQPNEGDNDHTPRLSPTPDNEKPIPAFVFTSIELPVIELPTKTYTQFSANERSRTGECRPRTTSSDDCWRPAAAFGAKPGIGVTADMSGSDEGIDSGSIFRDCRGLTGESRASFSSSGVRLRSRVEEPYVFSVAQVAAGGARMRDRRRSDPGDRVLQRFLQQHDNGGAGEGGGEAGRKGGRGARNRFSFCGEDESSINKYFLHNKDRHSPSRASNPRLLLIQAAAADVSGEEGEAFCRPTRSRSPSLSPVGGNCSGGGSLSVGQSRWSQRAQSLPGGSLLRHTMGASSPLTDRHDDGRCDGSEWGVRGGERSPDAWSGAGGSTGGAEGAGVTASACQQGLNLVAGAYSERTTSLLLCPPELPRRRRSLSLECSGRLEVIAEETGGGAGSAGSNLSVSQKSIRRYSVGIPSAAGTSDAPRRQEY